MKKVIITLLVLLLIGAGAYFAYTKLAGNEKEANKEVVYPNEIVYSITNVERVSELPDNNSTKTGNEFLVLTVYGENHDQSARKYNVFYFTFTDINGKTYENSLNTRHNAITFGELATGGNFTGTVVFEIPKDTTGHLVITDENFQEIQKIEIK